MAADRPRSPGRHARRRHTVGISGQSFLLNTNGSNLGSMFIMLEPFDERQRPRQLRRRHRRGRCRRECAARDRGGGRSASSGRRRSAAWATPAASSCRSSSAATSTCNELQSADRRAGRARPTQTRRFAGAVHAASAPTRRSCTWTSTAPSASRWRCRFSDVFNTLQVYMGGYYVNDFNQFGRTWQVNVQADAALPHRRRRRQAAPGAQRQGRDGAAGDASPQVARHHRRR